MHVPSSRAIGKVTSAFSLSLSLWRKRRGWLFEVCWKEWKLAKERMVEQIFRFVYKLPMARPRLTAASLASIFPLLHTRSNDPPPFAWLPLSSASPPLSSHRRWSKQRGIMVIQLYDARDTFEIARIIQEKGGRGKKATWPQALEKFATRTRLDPLV